MLLGLSRKKLGDIVFYRSDGQQRARVRVRTIKNPRSAKQAVQRMVLATASKTLAALRSLYNHSFENVAVGTPSLRYAQKIIMDGYRARAAVAINGADEYLMANFAIKGAPIAGCYEGMPLTKGRLSFNIVSHRTIGAEEGLSIALSEALLTNETPITSQAQYVAELAKLGLEPGDQLTCVAYGANMNEPVAQFASDYNFADMYRYARITFVTQLPAGFTGTLISADAFNPALIEKQEGFFPSLSPESDRIDVTFGGVFPTGYAMLAGTFVRSKKTDGGVTYYNNASFVANTTDWDWNNSVNVYPSYMDTEEAINVGDTLYLKNAEAAPFA